MIKLFHKKKLAAKFCELKNVEVTQSRTITFSQKLNPKAKEYFNKYEKELLPVLQAVVREDVKENGYNSRFINKLAYVRTFIAPLHTERKPILIYQEINKFQNDYRKEFKVADAKILKMLKTDKSVFLPSGK